MAIFLGGHTPGSTKNLLLILLLGITPGSALGTIWDAGDQTQVIRVQDKCPTHCAIAPAFIYGF